jgi:hypothetical protein
MAWDKQKEINVPCTAWPDIPQAKLESKNDCQEERLQGSGVHDEAWRVLVKKGKYGLGTNE